MAVSKENTRIIITLPKALKEEAEKIAENETRTLGNLTVVALKEYVKQKKAQNEFLQAENNENHN